MTLLSVLLATKILVTVVAVIVPFLLIQTEKLNRITGFGHPNTAFYRLYGMAMLALVVGYCGGLLQTLAGEYPTQIVAMGIVSNIGAATLMIWTRHAREQKVLAIFFGLAGVGFALAALRSDVAMRTVF